MSPGHKAIRSHLVNTRSNPHLVPAKFPEHILQLLRLF